jgi:hypothetical protein
MKLTPYLLILAAAMLVSPAFAEKHQAYDLTGEVSPSLWHSDGEAHVTVGGNTLSAHCSTEGSSISCTDSPGAYIITFADGSWTTLPEIDPEKSHMRFTGVGDDPLLAMMRDGGTHRFQYRLANFWTAGVGRGPFFCVGFSKPDAHGKSKEQEACYPLDSVVHTPRVK